MRTLPQGLSDHLKSRTTTLCWCWRLIRRDGEQLGFTDHDRDLEFDGTRFEAASGITASELSESVGLKVDTVEIDGALTSDTLSETDLASGLYDDAKVEVFRVNWSEPEQRVLMRSGSLGEVRRTDTSFTAEVRGLAHYLQQPSGRLFQYTCDAVLGDHRCSFDLDATGFTVTGTVSIVMAAGEFVVDLPGGYEDDWFARGTAKFDTGANQGTMFDIKRFRNAASGSTVTLWLQPVHAPKVGDQVRLVAGCDKHLDTCAGKFGNAINFRGFPFMPGNDFLGQVGT